ncbi:MAG: hypothetical protein H0V21_10305 [Rubrobacter sp.]|nr:hypothetical protein [Rubrobacter sp.]
MNEAIGSRNPWTTVIMMLLAVLVLLVVALASLMQPAATTGESNPGVHATSANGTGVPGFNDDPYIDRHTEVVARSQQDGPR